MFRLANQDTGLVYTPDEDEQLILDLNEAQIQIQKDEISWTNSLLQSLGMTNEIPAWLSDEDRQRIEDAQAKGYETYYITGMSGDPIPVTFSLKDRNIQRIANVLGEAGVGTVAKLVQGNPEWANFIEVFTNNLRSGWHHGMYQLHRDFGVDNDLHPIYRNLWDEQGVMIDIPSWQVGQMQYEDPDPEELEAWEQSITERSQGGATYVPPGVAGTRPKGEKLPDQSTNIMWVTKGEYHTWLYQYYETTPQQSWDAFSDWFNGKEIEDIPELEFMTEAGEVVAGEYYALMPRDEHGRLPVGSQKANLQSIVARQLYLDSMVQDAEGARTAAYKSMSDIQSLITRLEETGDPEIQKVIQSTYESARTQIREAIDLDRKSSSNLYDLYWNATWGAAPVLEEKFLEAIVDVEMQARRPLTQIEIQEIKQNYVDVGLTALSEVLFDPVNMVTFFGAPDLIIDGGKAVIGKTFRGVMETAGSIAPELRASMEALEVLLKGGKVADLDVVVRYLDELPVSSGMKGKLTTLLDDLGETRGIAGLIQEKFPVGSRVITSVSDGMSAAVRWLDEAGPVGALSHIRDLALESSVKSAAQKTAKNFMLSVNKLARGAASWDEFLGFLRKGLDGGAELSPFARGGADLAERSATMVDQMSLPGAFTKRDYINFSPHRSFGEVVEPTMRMKGWLNSDAVISRARRLREKMVATSMDAAEQRVRAMSAEMFEQTFGMSATADNLDVAIKRYADMGISNEYVGMALGDDLREALMDFNRLAYGSEPYKESLLYTMLRFIPAGVAQDPITKKFLSLGDLPVVKDIYRQVTKYGQMVKSAWVSAVLAFSPRWYFRNILDSGFRMMLHDPGAAIHDFGTISHSLLRHLPEDQVKGVFSNIWGGALDDLGLDAMDMIYRGDIQNLGNALTPLEFIKAAWKQRAEQSALNPLKLFGSIKDGGYAFNTAIEGMMRTRMMYNTFVKEFNPRFLANVTEELNKLIAAGADDITVQRARNLLMQGRDDITFLKSAGGNVGGYVSVEGVQHTMHIPMEQIRHLLDRVTPAQEANFLDDLRSMFIAYEEAAFHAGKEPILDDMYKMLDDASAYYDLQPEQFRLMQELDDSGVPNWDIDPRDSALPDPEMDDLADGIDPRLDAAEETRILHANLQKEYDDLANSMWTASEEELKVITERMGQIDDILQPQADLVEGLRTVLADDVPIPYQHSSAWVESHFPDYIQQARRTAGAHKALADAFEQFDQYVKTLPDKEAITEALESIEPIRFQYRMYERVNVSQKKILTEIFSPRGDWENLYYGLRAKHFENWMQKANELTVMLDAVMTGKKVVGLEPVNWRQALEYASIHFEIDSELNEIVSVSRLAPDGSITEYTDISTVNKFRDYVWGPATRSMNLDELAAGPAGMQGADLYKMLHPTTRRMEELAAREATLGLPEEQLDEMIDAYRVADDPAEEAFKPIHDIVEGLDEEARAELDDLAKRANRKNAAQTHVDAYRDHWKSVVADNEDVQKALRQAYRERVASNNNHFWRGAVNQMEWTKYGDVANSPDTLREYFQDIVKKSRRMGERHDPIQQYARSQLRKLDSIENVMHQVNESIFSRYSDEFIFEPKPIEFNIKDMWDSNQTAYWMMQRADQANLAFQDSIGIIKTIMREQAEAGAPLGGRLTNAGQASIWNGWMDGAVRRTQEISDLAMHGGDGAEGAFRFTQRIMLDYQEYTGFDNLIKGSIYPFWMFNSRSIALWAQVVAQKPYLASFWGRWHKYTGIQRQQAGFITTAGRPLGKLRNTIKIPGVDMWVNPLQVLSIGFVMPFDVHERLWLDQPTGDDSMMQNMANFIYDIGNYYGLGMAPWTKWALEEGGLLDESQVFWNSVLPFADLVPKFGDVGRFFENLQDAGMIPAAIGRQFTNPERPYEDYYVELELLRMLQETYQSEGEEAGLVMAGEIQKALGYELLPFGEEMAQAFMNPTDNEHNVELRASQPEQPPYRLSPREDNELWLKAKDRYMKDSYATTMVGWMTGFYPRIFSEEEAEIMRIRDQINTLKKSINNDMGALIFQYDVSREARYANSINQRFSTTAGWINNFYNSMRYQTMEDGALAQGTNRRELMVDQIHQDSVTTAYWQSIQAQQDWFRNALAQFPIGVDYRTTAHIYDQHFEWMNLLETSPIFASVRSNTQAGYKPVTQIEGYLEDKFWRTLRTSRPNLGMPQYQGDEGFTTWEADMELWKQSLPELAQIASRSFALTVVDYLTGGGGIPADQAKQILDGRYTTYGGVDVDIQSMLNDLMGEITAENYDVWEMTQHSPRKALEDAWRDLYWDRYWESVEGTGGHARELAIMQFQKIYQHPTDQSLIDWAMEKYEGGQFTEEALAHYLQQGSLTTQERFDGQSKDAFDTLVDRAWELARRVPPVGQDDVENVLVAYGVDPDLYDDLWDMQLQGLDRTDEEDMRRLQNFVSALEKMQLPEPTPSLQMEWAAVQDLNGTQREMAQLKYGEDIFKIQTMYYEHFDKQPAGMSTGEYKALRTDFLKVKFPQLEEYWDWRKVFAEAYPLWAKYYKPKLYKPITAPSDGPSFNAVVGETLWNDIVQLEAKGEKLNSSALTRLENIAERYPQYAQLVETILALQRLK